METKKTQTLLDRKTLQTIAAEMDRLYREADRYEKEAEISWALFDDGRARLARDLADHAYAVLEGMISVLRAAGYTLDPEDSEAGKIKIIKEA